MNQLNQLEKWDDRQEFPDLFYAGWPARRSEIFSTVSGWYPAWRDSELEGMLIAAGMPIRCGTVMWPVECQTHIPRWRDMIDSNRARKERMMLGVASPLHQNWRQDAVRTACAYRQAAAQKGAA